MEQLASDYHDKLKHLIDTLATQPVCIVPGFFDAALTDTLYQELKQYTEAHKLSEARVGKGDQQIRIPKIRGDAIHWLDGETEAQQQFLAIMDTYRQALNRQLFLGLDELEAHFSYYPPGMGYQKHLDSFQNNNLRRITIVVYLNPNWRTNDGGQLQIFDGDKIITEVMPQGGTLVSFISEEIPHQVAITNKERFSIAGWFRTRDAALI